MQIFLSLKAESFILIRQKYGEQVEFYVALI